MSEILTRLAGIIDQRKQADPDTSYVAGLQHSGLARILEKVEEEAGETIEAARDAESSGNNRKVVYETADLWFHSLVMLSHLNSGPQAVLDELERRFGVSGLEEKASRKKDQ